MHVLIVKHIKNEDAGTMLDYLDRSGLGYKKALLYAGESLPDSLDGISHVVVMGGTMNVYEEEKYPFLRDEDEFIRSVLERNIPFIGICLGGQLLAKACDADVTKAANAEIGVFDVELVDGLTDDDLGILGGLPNKFPTVQWHGDTFAIPKCATHIARSELCENQAFVINSNAYGMQFHPEVTEEMVRDWYDDVDNKDDIVRDYLRVKEEYDRAAYGIYGRFFAV